MNEKKTQKSWGAGGIIFNCKFLVKKFLRVELEVWGLLVPSLIPHVIFTYVLSL